MTRGGLNALPFIVESKTAQMAKDLKALKEKLKKVEDFFQKLPAHIVSKYRLFVNNNFKQEGFEDDTLEKWPLRSKQDKNEKKRGKRNLLVKSGALRRSIEVKILKEAAGSVVVVSSDMPYAKIHNEGLQVSYTAKVKAHNRVSSKGKSYKVSAHSRKVNFKMPKRQFMGLSSAFDKELIDFVEKSVENILK